MTCPDINDIIDFSSADEPDAALEAHLLTCPECREQLHLLRTLEHHFEAEEPLAEELVQVIMDALPAPEEAWALEPATPGEEAAGDEAAKVPVLHVLGSGLLGWLTAAFAMVMGGADGGLSLPVFVVLATLVAVGAGVAQVRMGAENGPLPSP